MVEWLPKVPVLTKPEKNEINERMDAIFRADEKRKPHLYEDFYGYIESILKDATAQARCNGARERKAQKAHD